MARKVGRCPFPAIDYFSIMTMCTWSLRAIIIYPLLLVNYTKCCSTSDAFLRRSLSRLWVSWFIEKYDKLWALVQSISRKRKPKLNQPPTLERKYDDGKIDWTHFSEAIWLKRNWLEKLWNLSLLLVNKMKWNQW